MKENDFFYFLKNLGMPGIRMRKYPKSTSTQKVFGTGTAPFLEYPCFIAFNLHLSVFPFVFQPLYIDEHNYMNIQKNCQPITYSYSKQFTGGKKKRKKECLIDNIMKEKMHTREPY